MNRIAKRDALRLTSAIDTPLLAQTLGAVIGGLVGEPTLTYEAAIQTAADIGRWTLSQRCALRSRDEIAMAALAIALSERRLIVQSDELPFP
jgi:hypothetical protein